MKEFSKMMVIGLGSIWIMGAVYGGWYAVRYGTGFAELLAFIGAPMTAVLAGYLCKAGFENVRKIKNSINERSGQ